MQHIKRLSIDKRILYKKYATSSAEATLTIDDIPRKRIFPVIGYQLDLNTAGGGTKFHEYIHRRHNQLGPVFRDKLGGNTDLVFISDPNLIRTTFLNLEGKHPSHILPAPWVLYEKLYGSKRGLFFMHGEEWLENRRIVNKLLLKEGSEKWLEIPVKATVKKFIEKMRNMSKSGILVPHLESEFYRFSIDVIVAIMLGENSSSLGKHYDAVLDSFTEAVKKIFQTTAKLEGRSLNLCQKLNLKAWRDFKESVDVSLSLAHKIVAEVIHNKQHSNGLVKMLSDENVSDENIKKIMGDFVIAAGDTTAYTSLWTLFLLSNDESVKAEIRRKNDQNYINCILKESMRLYPVAHFITRLLPKESVLGPYRLNEGTPIIASIYTSGRDDNYFSEAHKFLPYRWDRNDERKKDLVKHVPFASLPFALGARSCIGKKLAVLQITEVVSQIVKNFEIKCLNYEEIKANTCLVLVPSTEIKLMFSPLDTAVRKDGIA